MTTKAIRHTLLALTLALGVVPSALADMHPKMMNHESTNWGGLAMNSRVRVSWNGHWYTGTVRGLRNGMVLVRWDGKHAQKDTWVKRALVRAR